MYYYIHVLESKSKFLFTLDDTICLMKTLAIALLGIIAGFFAGLVMSTTVLQSEKLGPVVAPIPLLLQQKTIGFLPYWLLTKAKKDYSQYINTLTYFGLTLNSDGTIQKKLNEQESDPGWFALESGKVNSFLAAARNKGVATSLLVFSGEAFKIDQLVSDPKKNAENFVRDIVPVMKKYNFKDLNIDIESVKGASEEARIKFTNFIKEVRNKLNAKITSTITLEATASDFIKKGLINPKTVEPYVDSIVIMAYDYHYAGSFVTGPVAPLSGAGINSEFDVEAAVAQAIKILPPEKIIMGVPAYGYEWETIGRVPRSAVIPGTGLTASSSRVESLLSKCATCSAQFDSKSQEAYIIYFDSKTNTFHQIFYPDARSTTAKIKLAKNLGLGGIAVWALGYEDKSVLEPLKNYK